MIAYNHLIKFIPELKNDKQVFATYEDSICIKESPLKNILNDRPYKLNFYNNQGRSMALFSDRPLIPTQKGQLWVFEVKDVLTFFWYSGAKELEYIRHKECTEELLEYWALHIALPIFFTIDEYYDFFHAGAVEVDGKPILFVAESFGGKSTITDFFMKQGHVMISDDKVASVEKDGQFLALPSHPHHRPYRKMEDLGYFVKNFASEVKPIHAIYDLQKSDKDSEVHIEELKGIEKFKALQYASLMNMYFLRPKRFGFMTKVAKYVPVYRVNVPWDLNRLHEVHKKIVEHSNSSKSSN